MKKIETKDWKRFFPHKNIRKEQEESINFILNEFYVKGTEFVIGEYATGIGKSAIAVTVSRYIHNVIQPELNASYILTTQKILQAQYIKDFPELKNISAKTNYTCKSNMIGMGCDVGLKMKKLLNPDSYKYYSKNQCVYGVAKKEFHESNIGLTNMAFFLSHSGIDPNLEKRELLLIDECHNTESLVTEHSSLSITRYMCEEVLKIEFVNTNSLTLEKFVSWLENVYLEKFKEIIKGIETKLNNMKSESFLSSKSGIGMIKKLDENNRNLEKIEMILNDVDPRFWVMSIDSYKDKVTLRPLFAKKFTQGLLFNMGNKKLLMSGTILDKDTFCNNIGIDPKKAAFHQIGSPFPLKNRPVIFQPVGSMSKKNIKNTLPIMAKAINEILKFHEGQSGIIHCHAYHIAKYINDNVKDKRLLFHRSDDRHEILEMHMTTKDATVIVSPSFTEGVDLIGELSQFQIIVKTPFPFLGDNYVLEKMKRVPNWYEWQTIKTVIQASGRSVRSMDDQAITYILDYDWDRLMNQKSWMIPKWYMESIQR